MSGDSRLLSLILRHDPGSVGIALDPGGWVAIDDLAAALGRHGHRMGRDDIRRIAAESDKRRFTITPDGMRIRAAQGHSVEVDLGLAPAEPPERLYHGTGESSVAAILAEGLRPMTRRHVHLSADPATATRVGQRHGRPVVLTVAAGAMHRDGHVFWQADNGVWLTDRVAPSRLIREDDPVGTVVEGSGTEDGTALRDR